mmetsp:Transcript_22150/g.29224  ORF Transcript_22150/g.29224 Transcript_22150/m.29224 type:complete len:84 (-) Transcript_22150:17-268(-)
MRYFDTARSAPMVPSMEGKIVAAYLHRQMLITSSEGYGEGELVEITLIFGAIGLQTHGEQLFHRELTHKTNLETELFLYLSLP